VRVGSSPTKKDLRIRVLQTPLTGINPLTEQTSKLNCLRPPEIAGVAAGVGVGETGLGVGEAFAFATCDGLDVTALTSAFLGVGVGVGTRRGLTASGVGFGVETTVACLGGGHGVGPTVGAVVIRMSFLGGVCRTDTAGVGVTRGVERGAAVEAIPVVETVDGAG
jgi:hypothetical protein